MISRIVIRLSLILVLFLSCVSVNYAQQDAQFSQYMFNGIYINPAYAGYKGVWNAHFFYRKQWFGFNGAPQTMSFAIEGNANDDRVGLALQVANDAIGATNNTSVYASYAYRIPINTQRNRSLAFGLGGGIVNANVDIQRLDPRQPYDPSIAALAGSKLLPDARFGVFYNSDRFYIGASADRLLSNFWVRKDAEKEHLEFNLHWYLTSGMLVYLSDQVIWKPSILVKDDIYGPTNADINSMFLLGRTLWLGASYRTAIPLYNKTNLSTDLRKSANVIAIAEVFVGDKLRIGYSYDYSINTPTLYTNPTHEFSIGYYFKPQLRGLLSPRFF